MTTIRMIVSLKVIQSAMRILVIMNRAQIASIVMFVVFDCNGFIGSGCLATYIAPQMDSVC
jgi:hypothetical protein